MSSEISGFKTEVKLKSLGKSHWWKRENFEVLEDIIYYSELMGKTYTIPKGFVTDLASTPYIFSWLLPPDGEYKYEAVLHDYLYRTVTVDITRDQSDLVFEEAMFVGIVDAWKRITLVQAVQWFGSSSFVERVKI